jgi:hypothetical protein
MRMLCGMCHSSAAMQHGYLRELNGEEQKTRKLERQLSRFNNMQQYASICRLCTPEITQKLVDEMCLEQGLKNKACCFRKKDMRN